MLTSWFGAGLRNSNWNQHVHHFQPRRALPPDEPRIPHELLAAESDDTRALDDAIRTLRKYSLIETDPGTVSVHRLVQRAIQVRMTFKQCSEHAEHAVKLIESQYPEKPFDVNHWPLCESLMAHSLYAV